MQASIAAVPPLLACTSLRNNSVGLFYVFLADL